ncbi:MAG: T9SS type A sorting domain-containing protein [Bacteroidales bacterium]|jgi:thiol-disulfide isomerase/thioredoxin|nr:T9SS type A sorting domain-containing protein [Bacteroidales bacterium]MDD3701097.1 T9SS type A sorting domain-containing protein [Bacteroidales bacterium]MDY0368544.1 T9SS type A sorting domain-containing protein [Bacteroidales bacterium]
MKRLLLLLVTLVYLIPLTKSQTQLTTAIDFWAKTIDGELFEMFPTLDEGKLVVMDFFSTSCYSCQIYAYDFQLAYEGFGYNEGNVFFIGMNYNGDNEQVRVFDSTYNITLPSVSGLDGGGNKVFEAYEIISYPTVIVVKPDKSISAQYIWPPTVENITEEVLSAGGIWVGIPETANQLPFSIYPNPASHTAHIAWDKPFTQARLQLQSIDGNILYQQELNGAHTIQPTQSIELPISGLENGIYIVTVSTDKIRFTQKLVIHHTLK